jgi:Zn-dependent M28 family amino/carboxypeptidase
MLKFRVLLLAILLNILCLNVIYGKKDQTNIPVDQERLTRDVQALTSILPHRNYKHLKSLNRAARYIFSELKKNNPHVIYQPFKVKDNEYKNIIVTFNKEKKERLVVGAHYDVCGNQPGADDNGSGVAALLELSRMVSQLKPHLSHRLDLVAYTLEEPPFFRSDYMGSAVHARSLSKVKAKVLCMISMDMIGYFARRKGTPSYRSVLYKDEYANSPNTTAVIGLNDHKKMAERIARIMDISSKIEVIPLFGPRTTLAIDFSDHLNYWNNGYPAVMLSNIFISSNPYYHSKQDTIDLLDFSKLAEVVKGMYAVVTSKW